MDKDGIEALVYLAIIVVLSVFIGVIAGICISFDNSITPMDVYQGKTTLEYKVVDGVKVDSTVVWKEE